MAWQAGNVSREEKVIAFSQKRQFYTRVHTLECETCAGFYSLLPL